MALNSTLFGPASMLAAVTGRRRRGVRGQRGQRRHPGPALDRPVGERLIDHGVAGIVLIAPVDTATEALEDLTPTSRW